MAEFDSQALPFQIRVLEGEMSQAILQDGQQPGVIQLVGRSLPLQEISFGGSQRHQTSWAPGSPQASQQAIGPVEDPTTVQGEWNDRYLGDGQARALMEVLDSLRIAGVSVEVSWGGGLLGTTDAPVLTGAPIVRVGSTPSVIDPTSTSCRIPNAIQFAWLRMLSSLVSRYAREIGRASCRERVLFAV